MRTLRRIIKRIAYGPSALRQEDLMLMYQTTFSGSSGEVVLEDLCRRFHITGSTFSPDKPYETTFKEGERNVVLFILGMVNAMKEGGRTGKQ